MRNILFILTIASLLCACGAKTPDAGKPATTEGNQADSGDATDIFHAAGKGSIAKLKEFIANGGDIKSTDENGHTLLHAAVQGLNTDIVEFLLAEGVEVNAKDNFGRTPMHLVQVTGRSTALEVPYRAEYTDPLKTKKIAELLIGKDADINTKDNRGSTPLHAAAEWSKIEVVKRLIDEGADINARDLSCTTPLDCAKRDDIRNFLISLGAVTGRERKKKQQ